LSELNEFNVLSGLVDEGFYLDGKRDRLFVRVFLSVYDCPELSWWVILVHQNLIIKYFKQSNTKNVIVLLKTYDQSVISTTKLINIQFFSLFLYLDFVLQKRLLN
jgi:hypothetical protein